ncbi:hypothetical protein [Alloalcanivorax gelatiniphagus]|uniref:hypothetical protein n=1 Tax=Alloalcanivorax gelatiniphagus TaxID=1194167 RepID=UPI001476EEA3|nr:hypothetical protein [Alloalcanivorax gelatiniphagus]|tara:strand:+ start:2289 stop:2744 length:456 start_codon:yes stop_codon:yes gene_type:complete
MSKKTLPDELQGLIHAHPALARLARAANRQQQGTHGDPRECLPPALRDRVRLVEQEQRWLALVETSATAHLLRFHLPRLERALPSGQAVKIVVTGRRELGASAPGAAPAAGPTLDAGSARHLRQAADYIDDPDLAAALRRLAGRAGSSDRG